MSVQNTGGDAEMGRQILIITTVFLSLVVLAGLLLILFSDFFLAVGS